MVEYKIRSNILLTGLLILSGLYITSYYGYIIVWGYMFYWGGPVITSLLLIIP